MTRDLEKAAGALAAGRRDEAGVYAWNALADLREDDAQELARVAAQLDDLRLLLELERRGIVLAPVPEVSTSGSGARSRGRRLRGVVFPLLVALVLVTLAVSEISTEGGPVQPTEADTYVQLRTGPPLLTVPYGVYLVPLGRAETVDLDALAEELIERYRIPVGKLHELALPRWTLDPNEPRLVAEQLIRVLGQSYPARDGGVVIGITDYDMVGENGSLPHTFSWRQAPHYGVVSTSELGASLLDRLRGHSRHERTRKLIGRNIGFLLYRRPQVDDPRSLLRSQMSGVDDIDRLDETLESAVSESPSTTTTR